MFENYTQRAKKILMLARKEAIRLNNEYVDTEHILLGLVSEGEGVAAIALQNLGVDLESIKIETENLVSYGNIGVASPEEKLFTSAVKNVLKISLQISKSFDHNYIGTEHILLGLIKEETGIASKVLDNLGAYYESVEKEVMSLLGMNKADECKKNVEKSKIQLLLEFGRDITQLAMEDKLDPVIGRDKEIERVIQILSRRMKNNPVLIGEAGVGKTAILEGLAQRIVTKQIPEILQDRKIISLDLAQIIAGTKYRGQFEERLKAIMKEVKEASGKIILFIDEIHTIIGAGAAEGAIDASNMFKPALARGELQCVGATTVDEYRKYIEKDGSLDRRFQKVIVSPTTKEETINILHGLKHRYEDHHKVKISNEAINAAVELSDRYISERFLPDKAIDLIDEASSKAKLARKVEPDNLTEEENKLSEIIQKKDKAVLNQDYEIAAQMRDKEREHKSAISILKNSRKTSEYKVPIITAEEISQIISRWTGIPVNKLEEKETLRYLNMEKEIHKNFIGQEEAVKTICKAIRRSKAKLKNPKRPIGSFIFLGPTGVGKSFLAKILAKFLFGNEDVLISFDMSEYQEKFSLSRLIGSPPGYVGYEEGGVLTEKIRKKPYSVLLFDEIEKAHPDIFNIFLQILEEGRLTDSLGHIVDFRNTVIIMTSNIGAKKIEKSNPLGFINFEHSQNYDQMKKGVIDELKNTFRPELLNRFDETIVFRSLVNSELKKIIEMIITELETRVDYKGINIVLSEDAKDFLLEKRDNPTYGARPLMRTIQKYIEDPLTEAILCGKIQDETCIKINLEGDKLDFVIEYKTLELAACD